MSAADATVLEETRGPIRILTLNRPGKRNAIDLDLRQALAERLESAQQDAGLRVVVLTGAGGAFSSGGDIATMERLAPAAARPRAEAAQRVIRAMWAGPHPVVAAVEGAAYGAGLALAMACDLVIAAQDARFSTAFQTVGLAGDMGVFASLPARVGRQAARRLLLRPRVLTGGEAVEAGIADELVETGAALPRALDVAADLALLPPLAVAEARRLLGAPDRTAVLDAETDAQVRLWDSDDFAEGAAAFRQRRPPVFRGA